MTIEGCPPIAPMSPRTSALNRQKSYLNSEPMGSSNPSSNSSNAETNRRDEKSSSFSENEDRDQHVRPQNLLRPTSSQNSTSFIGPLGKSGGQNQKHAISPICCEVSVPALQSPKNAVAPSDIIFDRPSGPTIISYSSNSNGSLQVKPNFEQHHSKNDISVSFNLNGTDHKPIALRKPDADAKHKAVVAVVESVSSKSANGKPEDEQKPKLDEKTNTSAAFLPSGIMTRSCSVGYLDMVDAQMVPPSFRLSNLNRGDNPSKRLILVNNPKDPNKKRQSRLRQRPNAKQANQLEKSKSLDSSDIFHSSSSSPSFVLKQKQIPEQREPSDPPPAEIAKTTNVDKIIRLDDGCNSNINYNNSSKNGEIQNNNINNNNNNNNRRSARDFFSSPLMRRKKEPKGKTRTENEESSPIEKNGVPIHTQALVNLEKLITRLREDDSSKATPPSSPRLPRSSPSSPAPSKKGFRPQSASPIRRKIMNSPFLRRRHKNIQESSDDEVTASGDEIFNGTNYKDLETFQKSQLRQKLKRGKIEPNGASCCNNNQNSTQRREFVMHNKAPMWNENSQVYQLDFGGRVTQESAKNFQIEFRGKQVMQFGRIDGNAYTLDFQYPFSALQAFAVALANVTQRLK